MQDGIFRGDAATDPDDPRYALHLLHEFATPSCAWFKPGLVPQYMKFLAHDTMSFFFGFEGDATEMHSVLEGDISPRPELFRFIQQTPCCYLLNVDDRWWEGYSSIPVVKAKLRMRLDAAKVQSDRWTGDGVASFPEFD